MNPCEFSCTLKITIFLVTLSEKLPWVFQEVYLYSGCSLQVTTCSYRWMKSSTLIQKLPSSSSKTLSFSLNCGVHLSLSSLQSPFHSLCPHGYSINKYVAQFQDFVRSIVTPHNIRVLQQRITVVWDNSVLALSFDHSSLTRLRRSCQDIAFFHISLYKRP